MKSMFFGILFFCTIVLGQTISSSHTTLVLVSTSSNEPGIALPESERQTTDIDEEHFHKPSNFQLFQNYPNPLDFSTRIKFSIKLKDYYQMSIYNFLGRVVLVLLDQQLTPGTYEIFWNGLDSTGKMIPAGTYFYQLHTSTYNQTRQMSVVK